jgi:hypothetical protein
MFLSGLENRGSRKVLCRQVMDLCTSAEVHIEVCMWVCGKVSVRWHGRERGLGAIVKLLRTWEAQATGS